MSTATAAHYELDFYGWVQDQARALRTHKFSELDIDNLVEEIESMGRSEKRELASRLEVLLMYLLKWQFQPKRRGTSWELTIGEQRRRLAIHLAENSSLKSQSGDALVTAYDLALYRAAEETTLPKSAFPEQCPWTFDEVTHPDFWPEAA